MAAEPGDEGLQRRAHDAGARDDEIAEIGSRVLEQDLEPAGGELALDHGGGGQRDAVAVAQTFEHHVSRQMNDALGPRGQNAAVSQPARHLAGAEFLQPGQIEDVVRFDDAAVADQRWCAHQDVGGRQQELDLNPAPVAVAIADGDVDAARTEADELGRGVEHQPYLGVLVAKLGEPRHQPAHREGRGGGDLQRPGGVNAGQLVHGATDVVEGAVERRGELRALRGQDGAAALPVEQRNTELILQCADPLADGGVADVQRRPRPGEAAGLRQRREGAQRAERGKGAPIHA